MEQRAVCKTQSNYDSHFNQFAVDDAIAYLPNSPQWLPPISSHFRLFSAGVCGFSSWPICSFVSFVLFVSAFPFILFILVPLRLLASLAVLLQNVTNFPCSRSIAWVLSRAKLSDRYDRASFCLLQLPHQLWWAQLSDCVRCSFSFILISD